MDREQGTAIPGNAAGTPGIEVKHRRRPSPMLAKNSPASVVRMNTPQGPATMAGRCPRKRENAPCTTASEREADLQQQLGSSMGVLPMVGSNSSGPRRQRPMSRCHQGPTGHRPVPAKNGGCPSWRKGIGTRSVSGIPNSQGGPRIASAGPCRREEHDDALSELQEHPVTVRLGRVTGAKQRSIERNCRGSDQPWPSARGQWLGAKHLAHTFTPSDRPLWPVAALGSWRTGYARSNRKQRNFSGN